MWMLTRFLVSHLTSTFMWKSVQRSSTETPFVLLGKENDVAYVAAINLAQSVESQAKPSLPAISQNELIRAQRRDTAINEIIKLKQTKTVLTNEDGNKAGGPVKRLLHEWGKLSMEGDLLYRRAGERKQLILPVEYRPLLLRHLHDDMGHLGADGVIGLARSRFYWPFIDIDIEAYVMKQCPCIKQKKPVVHDRGKHHNQCTFRISVNRLHVFGAEQR